MAPNQEVVRWLDTHFPKPRVDPEWLDGCCEWLTSDQNLSPDGAFPKFMEKVKEQLLESDLNDSMLHGTGLDPVITTATENLRGPPILVQIVAMTEIGTSAFQLEQTRAAREERLLSGVGDVEGEEEGDVEVEGEGPMPKYPRGTLRFQLSDGLTTLEAMEYRPLPQITLGITPLGFKMQLKGTHIQNGMAFLEPATVNILGGKQAELDVRQNNDLKRGLQQRLGHPEPEPEQQLHAHERNAAAAIRSPLRDISPPPIAFPQHDDDVEMEPRRRLPTNSSLNNPHVQHPGMNLKETRPTVGFPSRRTSHKLDSNAEKQKESDKQDRIIPKAERATLAYAGSHKNQPSTSAYFAGESSLSGEAHDKAVDITQEGLSFNFTPTTRQLSRTIPSPSPEPPAAGQRAKNRDSSFDFDLLDEFETDENQPPPQASKSTGNVNASRSSPGPAVSLKTPGNDQNNDGSSDYGMDDEIDFMDPEIFEHLDGVEKAAFAGNHTHPSSSVSGSASGLGSGISSSSYDVIDNVRNSQLDTAKSALAPSANKSESSHSRDVIEIEDSDEDMLDADDKENEPVPTRHVRRRLDDDTTSSALPSQIRGPALSQRTGRPVVLATNPGDIIDLSDSD